MQGRVLPLPLELQEMLNSYLGSTHLWPAKRNLALKMKQLPPQFVSILAIYCFCMLQIPSSGFPRPLADPPDDLDIMQLEWLAYGATLSWQTKDSRTDAGDFTKKDHTATLGRPFFLFRMLDVYKGKSPEGPRLRNQGSGTVGGRREYC
ncbi:neuromedin-S isoform X5 [Leopardus geoffroyi]|uniref:neuromedin-S isoform X5 n=1 Tax=Leopardus geoffroyi TaxID=46844 RepID=UPI001E264726|nr:neuromedin-S isoform X5 [Leopardus geoffroyi]